MRREYPNGCVLELIRGDITKIPVDAIANAANQALAGGGGVDGAIHRAGGPKIMEDLRQYDGCPTGSAVATSAGNLPAHWVFHAVGPVYRDGRSGEPGLLASAYRSCLALAEKHGAKSLSFPSISTGIYGYPVDEAAPIALAEVARHMEAASVLERVIFVLFDEKTLAAYESALK